MDGIKGGGIMISDKNPLLAHQVKLWREQIKPTIITGFNISPDDKFNWAPAHGMITLGNLFTHISECSEWWYEEVIGNRPSTESGFPPKPATLSRIDIAKYLDNHWQRLEDFFASDPAILKRNFKVTGRDKDHDYSGYWIFTHMLEHDIHHRSQINQYLHILGIVPPRI
jgi:uncharacterized damage-inducible protein DinB